MARLGDHRGRREKGRGAGFSLLEVILALAILAGAIAVLGEAGRLALRNAETARDLARAQVLCESKLAEIVAGLTAPDPVENTAFDTTNNPDVAGWLYSIQSQPTDENGLISVQVTVSRDLPAAQHPIQFSLVRWMADPNAVSSSQSSQEGSSGSSSGSSSGAGGSNNNSS
ncbi:MAG: prepilin-type N-terminal cleavage/methylation domain-containing protein [Thermoguttaceae bacterium]